MFHWKVEITSVATNGSWVTTMVKISAGSSGTRRFHLAAPEDFGVRAGGGAVLGSAVSVVMKGSSADDGRGGGGGARPARGPAGP